MNDRSFSLKPLCVVVAIGVWISTCVIGCTQRHPEEDEGSESSSRPVVAVKTAPVARGDFEVTVVATGKTDALRKEKVYSPIGGTLVSLKVLEGMKVKRGDLVALVQPRETRAAIVGAEALLHSAQTGSERTEAKRALELAQAGQNNVAVRAGFDGVVASRNVAEGELVTENAELMTIVDLTTMTFLADVPLRAVPDIHVGQPAIVEFPSLAGKRFPATVEAQSPQSDLQSQTLKVRLRFRGLSAANQRMLRTEMAGEATIITGVHRNVLLVPKGALLRNDETDSYTIVIATTDSVAHVTPVEVDGRNDSTAEVRGPGLTAGMQIIVEGNYALPDSSRIAPVR